MDSPRTRLEQLLRQRHLTVDDFRAQYERLSGDALSARQAYRWVAGHLTGLPYPRAQDVVERMLGEPAAQLFGPPLGAGFGSSSRASGTALPARGGWPDQLVATSAARARDFLRTAEATNVGDETIDQLADDVRRLAGVVLSATSHGHHEDIVDAQGLRVQVPGRSPTSRPYSRSVPLAGIASGLMAKASHDVGARHRGDDPCRAAYTCADNAPGTTGLRVLDRGYRPWICTGPDACEDSASYARTRRGTAGRLPRHVQWCALPSPGTQPSPPSDEFPRRGVPIEGPAMPARASAR